MENYRKLKEVGIGTYVLFQETYNKEKYEMLHPTGPKHNYAYHTEAMDRAMEGGIDDVGCGVLFGLDLYKYDFVGLLMHAEHLEAVHGSDRIRSVCRDCAMPMMWIVSDFENAISDELFQKIVAILRISVPYTGIIVSCRESRRTREMVLKYVFLRSAAVQEQRSGGYAEAFKEENSAQFETSDNRDVGRNCLLAFGSRLYSKFLYACYREGRTGDRFMSLVKSGQIRNCCLPNALMTLKEYAQDYASPKTHDLAIEMIKKEAESIPNLKVRDIVYKHLNDIEGGMRDFRL